MEKLLKLKLHMAPIFALLLILKKDLKCCREFFLRVLFGFSNDNNKRVMCLLSLLLLCIYSDLQCSIFYELDIRNQKKNNDYNVVEMENMYWL
jgi:hypothetical protein